MAEAFYGRAAVYDAAIDAGNAEGLHAALERNLYSGETTGIESMAVYVLESEKALSKASRADIISAILNWPDIPQAVAAATGEIQ
jgi:cytochrome b pre-mRNA-processing protein 3